jgi:hypothetical protein
LDRDLVGVVQTDGARCSAFKEGGIMRDLHSNRLIQEIIAASAERRRASTKLVDETEQLVTQSLKTLSRSRARLARVARLLRAAGAF